MNLDSTALAYQSGFGNEFSSEALPGALPVGQNSPQKAPYGLYAELLSGTAFTMARSEARRTWLYRITPSAKHPPFRRLERQIAGAELDAPTPNRLRWDPLALPEQPTDFLDGLLRMAANAPGDKPAGVSIYQYLANRSMERCFYDADGELLLVPQLGRLRLCTELGALQVEPLEIAVIPRGMKFRVELLDGEARGYIAENHGAPLRLPDLGPIGSNGLTVLMVFAGSLESLMLARFVCGIGMGGAMPSAMALMAEYSPPRLRTLMVTLAACGFSFGGAAGGFVAAAFMDGFGWQAVFLAGGVTPLLLFPFLLLFLPESLPRLLRDAPPYARLRQLSERMAPGWQPPPAQADAEPAASLTVLELFRHGYARPTLLLWATFFVSLILLYFMVSWLPSLLQESGLTRNAANLATSMFLFAGTLGAMLLAWLADRLRSKVRLLAAILAGAALFTLLLGLNHDQPRWLLAFVFAAGFCIIGGQLTLNAFASNFYPAQVRATGTGWALGVGRFGSILGPLFGSLLLGMHISVENIFMLAAIPAGLAALLILQVRSPAAQAQRESAAALAVEES